MAESNFVDYVKIYCRSGKEDAVPCICAARNIHLMEDPTVATVVEEVMLFYGKP